MSRLDELIQELCPDGVEYKTVGALANISRGRVMSKNYIAENAGEYPVYSSQTENDGELGKISTYDFEGEYLTWTTDGANAGSVFYRNGKFSVTNVCGLINCNDDEILTRYMYHYLSKNAKSYVSSGMGNPKLMSNVMARIKVAVPPLEVQREIVCILDSFTLRTAELTARKKQYQYYLNHYFESQLDNLVSLDSLGTLTRGKRFVHADAIGQGVPCIHYGELYTYYGVYANNVKSYIREELRPKMRYAHKGDVIIVGAGENNIDIGIGVAWEGDEDVAVHDACYILRHSQNSKYISYFLRSDMYHNQIKKYVSEGKICSISAKGLGKAMIPLPSIAEQQKIVEILDRFDALCNDLTSGLPAEINARQKQYEYYRDKLLSFK